MIYYARSENEKGEKETVQHHLLRTAELCRNFAGEFGFEEAGNWMGLLHDFGKYSPRFQDVLDHRISHVDHAMPGAAFLAAKLCGKNTASSPYWPMAVAVRCHHGPIRYDISPELQQWCKGGSQSPENNTYSLTAGEVKEATAVFGKEVKLPAVLPEKPVFGEKRDDFQLAIEKMLLIRMLFSALTDADYSASAEHFTDDYLKKSSIPPFNPWKAYESLAAYKAEISKNSKADPNIDHLRNDLYEVCRSAGAAYASGLYTLTAPTGAGKTLSMLAFALQQMCWQKKKRIILILPYLSIIEQNANVYRHILPDILEDHSQVERNDEFSRELSQRWDAPFIITTSVKFFESLFSCTGPACRKLHTLADSVILFDEAQSLPVHLAETTLTSLRELAERYRATVVFSTATQPDFDQLPGLTWKPKEIVADCQTMFAMARRVRTDWRLQNTSALEEIAAEMAEKDNACMIVNLRSHAQKAYDALKCLCNSEDVYLLTTDLCPAHRTKILDEIRQKLREQRPCYLIATQCIEAGVDISFDVLYRALAPLESIIQAAGRCNRNDARKRGSFTVFIPEECRLYPDPFYQQAANAVLTLAARHAIDINDLSDIREYYGILYGSGTIYEKKELTDAVERMDFQGVAQAYRLIEDDQLQILVPCPGMEELFYDLADQVRQSGVTAAWMRKAAPLTVHSYQREAVQRNCEPLFVHIGRQKIAANWYILCNSAFYDPRKGLQWNTEFDGII